ncbi:SIN3-HDAC complex-associated factor [Lycorma delicatula]|uniref:SIN3-HDAC complex-associated factor n=1 Tax=Lycorma delicatula TaxID=130591 RepID=UPI003F51401A
MFSFHKPKVYRSSTGCCICKAKSSSSRFTDSKKYEEDFVECFQLEEKRTGEVCNACVLLVKRWKKLPEGSQRNWRHVVDARAGPGTKSSNKFKSKNKRKAKGKSNEDCCDENVEEDKKDLIEDIRERSPSVMSDEANGADSSDGSIPPSPTPSDEPPSLPLPSTIRPRTRATLKRLAPPPLPISSFIDTTYWKREKICCGIIFKGPNGEVVVDPRFIKPCKDSLSRHLRPVADDRPTSNIGSSSSSSSIIISNASTAASAIQSVVQTQVISKTKAFSDTSSDSGYDESSNQGEVGVVTSIGSIGVSHHQTPVNN